MNANLWTTWIGKFFRRIFWGGFLEELFFGSDPTPLLRRFGEDPISGQLNQLKGLEISTNLMVATQRCFIFIPDLWGFMIQFDLRIFFNWVGSTTNYIDDFNPKNLAKWWPFLWANWGWAGWAQGLDHGIFFRSTKWGGVLESSKSRGSCSFHQSAKSIFFGKDPPGETSFISEFRRVDGLED